MEQSQHETEQFGLLGHPLAHSLSPYIHKKIMEAVKINGSYKLIDTPLEKFQTGLDVLTKELHGYNVTIPYKERIIPKLSGVSDEARAYGAVNTVYQNIGYNTDGAGFASMEIQAYGKHILIIGSGGASRSISYVLAEKKPASITFLVRDPERAIPLTKDLSEAYPGLAIEITGMNALFSLPCMPSRFQILINTTPVGMWPLSGELPLPHGIYQEMLRSGKVQYVFDAVYNPTATRFVLMAKSYGIWAKGGLNMLFQQAFASQKIWHPNQSKQWTDQKLLQKMEAIRSSLAFHLLKQSPLKIVLTGFMGAGKTTTAALLSSLLKNEFRVYDLDQEIEKVQKKPIRDIFEESGEDFFRDLEKKELIHLLASSESVIISTGGGAILQENTPEMIHDSGGLIILLDVTKETVFQRIHSDNSRPLINRHSSEEIAGQIERLLTQRNPIYHATADLIIDANQNVELRANAILKAFELERQVEK